jgi:hypothetical protein
MIGVSRQAAVHSFPQQTGAATSWVAARFPLQTAGFASGEGASLRHSADHHLQDAGAESPGPDSTNINQKSPLPSDKEGNPKVGKLSTADGDDENSPKVSPGDVEDDDVVPNLQTPKD